MNARYGARFSGLIAEIIAILLHIAITTNNKCPVLILKRSNNVVEIFPFKYYPIV